MRFIGLAWMVFGAACADPVVTMKLQVAAGNASFDTSCVQTVDVFVDGPRYPTDEQDYTHDSIALDARAQNLGGLDAILRDKFEVPMPSDGLAAVELYGWNGPSGWNSNPVPPDLVFLSRATYVPGADTLVVPVIPNVSCQTSTMQVRAIDMLALAKTHDCTQAGVTTSGATISLGTLTPALYKDEVFYWGGSTSAPINTGVAAINGPMQVGPDSCLALDGGDGNVVGRSCSSGGPGVCGHAGEIETAVINAAVAKASLAEPYASQYKGIVFGAVWSNSGGVRAPVAGATVTLDPKLGVVTYVDPDAAYSKLGVASRGVTGASGMFIVYTNAIVDLKVTSGSLAKTVRVGASNDSPATPAATLVMMN